MLTIFSSPRPLTEDRFYKIQANALQSWTHLRPRPEIILFGDAEHETGIEKLVKFGCDKWWEAVRRNQWGAPLVGDLILKAQRIAKYPLVAWVNTDMILRQDFMDAVEIVSSQLREFLIVGAKWRLYGDPPDIDFSDDWQRHVGKLCRHNGERQPRSGSNYQVFNNGLFRGKLYERLEDRPKKHVHKDFPIEFPPIAWGRIRMDTWLVWQALRRGIPVVDVTDTVLAVHQDHRHIGKKVIKQDSGSAEIKLQDKLTERRESGGGRISNATWILNKKGELRKKE